MRTAVSCTRARQTRASFITASQSNHIVEATQPSAKTELLAKQDEPPACLAQTDTKSRILWAAARRTIGVSSAQSIVKAWRENKECL